MKLSVKWLSRTPARERVTAPGGVRFELVRDAFGVPTVVADGLEEALVGWGYACAADRYFQLCWTRRVLRGTLAALVGDRPLGPAAPVYALRGARVSDLDLLARALDLPGAARASLESCSPAARAAAESYARGVNAWVERHGAPLACRLLGEEPSPWRAEDSALVLKGVALMLTFSWRAALGELRARGDARSLDLTSVPTVPATADAAHVGELIDALRASLGAGPGSAASNAVALAPSRTRTGGALVASDPHMPFAAPGVFWEVGLRTRELRAQGACIPGAPVLSIGQTDRVAWAVTSGWGDDSQLYLEPPEVLHGVAIRQVSVPRRGQDALRATLRTTARGPVLSDVLPALGAAVGSRGGLSLRWVGLEATRELDAALGMLRARSALELRDALARHATPTLNVVFADAAGETGFQFAGRIPRRARNGLHCANALDPAAQWNGYLETPDLPGCGTLPSGVIVSCNTQPSGDAPYAALTEPPYRFLRWHQMLGRAPAFDPAEVAAMQCDVTSAWAREVGRALAPHLLPRERQRLLEWDGDAHRTSATAALIYATFQELCAEVGAFAEPLAATMDLLNAPLLPLTRRVVRRLEAADGAVIARAAVARAQEDLRARTGKRDGWAWGELHRARFRHPLQGSPLEVVFADEGIPLGGDGTTVSMASFSLGRGFDAQVGPVLRYVMDVAHPGRSRGVLVPGQSDVPWASHYDDQVPLWSAGKLRALAHGFRA